MVFYGFSSHYPANINGFLIAFLWVFYGFSLGFFDGFSMVFLWIFNGISMDFLWVVNHRNQK